MTWPQAFAITVLAMTAACVLLAPIVALWESCEHQPRRRNRRVGS
jgi:hypothetical protein